MLWLLCPSLLMLWLLCPSLFYFVVSFKTLMPDSTRRQLMRLVLHSTMLAVIAGCSRSTSAQPAAAKPPAPAPVRADTAALRRVLDSIADAHHGIVGYSRSEEHTSELQSQSNL